MNAAYETQYQYREQIFIRSRYVLFCKGKIIRVFIILYDITISYVILHKKYHGNMVYLLQALF